MKASIIAVEFVTNNSQGQKNRRANEKEKKHDCFHDFYVVICLFVVVVVVCFVMTMITGLSGSRLART